MSLTALLAVLRILGEPSGQNSDISRRPAQATPLMLAAGARPALRKSSIAVLPSSIQAMQRQNGKRRKLGRPVYVTSFLSCVPSGMIRPILCPGHWITNTIVTRVKTLRTARPSCLTGLYEFFPPLSSGANFFVRSRELYTERRVRDGIVVVVDARGR